MPQSLEIAVLLITGRLCGGPWLLNRASPSQRRRARTTFDGASLGRFPRHHRHVWLPLRPLLVAPQNQKCSHQVHTKLKPRPLCTPFSWVARRHRICVEFFGEPGATTATPREDPCVLTPSAPAIAELR